MFADAWFRAHHANAVKYNTMCLKTFVNGELASQQNPQNQQNLMRKHEFVDFAIKNDCVQVWHMSCILTVKNEAKITKLH